MYAVAKPSQAQYVKVVAPGHKKHRKECRRPAAAALCEVVLSGSRMDPSTRALGFI